MKKYLMLILFVPFFVLAQTNPFLPFSDSIIVRETSIQEQQNRPSLAKKTPFLQNIIEVQKSLQEKMSTALKTLKTDFSMPQLLLLLIIAFAYGVIHSMGPGHAKLLIGSQLMASKHGKKDAVKAGTLFAVTHTGVAMVLFIVVNVIIKLKSGSSDAVTVNLLKASGVMIIFTALYLFWETISDLKEPHKSIGSKGNSLFLIALIAGLSPCPGALLILIFSNLLGVALYGFIAVIFVSMGMAVTVSSIAVVTVIGRETVLFSAEKMKFLKIALLTLRISGVVILLIIGWSFL